ncbi:hypothetical protein D3OALGA1CA_5109 [Olavius algarvensis associated proteobacterium Delta 3]|nr:hypothetical protein D3OALGA1CA_5109 [Olavius algarvensis associated proteobacterium Delta 3]
MPKCNSCGKRGLFLKIEEDTGLCLECNEQFAKTGKVLTEKITQAKNAATVNTEPADIVQNCKDIERFGNELIQLHRRFKIEPSNELLDLITTYKKMGELAANQTH